MTDYYLILNGNLHVTPNHLMLVDGKWMEAGKINPDDSLLMVDHEKSSAIPVTSIKKIFKRVETYNLEVEDYGTYIANGIVVNSNKISALQANNMNRI